MSRKLNSVSALLALVVLMAAASAAMSQVSKNPTRGRSKPRFAVVAVKWDGKVQLARTKDRVIEVVQKAFSGEKEGGRVTNVEIKSFEKATYFAISIEDQGTLYLQLVPSDGGFQEIFHIGDLNYLYCSGCKTCVLVPPHLSQNTGPSCECEKNQTADSDPGGTDCSLHPVRAIAQLTQRLNDELLAVGFEATDGGTSVGEAPQSNGTNPTAETLPRTKVVKRPND
ncbi:MAG TPA: hypothetical protein VNG71_03345 [Pyrinomonadaceae bacterium]|nr:hypothetical protein [Pyrinomonadaceae bacterium]